MDRVCDVCWVGEIVGEAGITLTEPGGISMKFRTCNACSKRTYIALLKGTPLGSEILKAGAVRWKENDDA